MYKAIREALWVLFGIDYDGRDYSMHLINETPRQ